MDPPQNLITGLVIGPVVQAHTITGDVNLHLPNPAPSALAGLPPDEGFTGRDEHLATLRHVLSQDAGTAVCAIAGLAGVGKTALAVRAARLAVGAEFFPGGVLFTDLQGYDPARAVDATSALAAFLRALGVPGEHIPPEQAEREALYRSVLEARAVERGPVLVIADNAATLDQVLPLRPASPAHRMLITSRSTLPVPAARRLELDVLPEREALALLAGSLTAANPADLRITGDPDQAGAVARLCGLLPLALRITAQLLADDVDRPISDLVDHLSATRDRLGELAYGDSVAVRAAFDASYHHLPAEQARVFRLLALNPGPHVSLAAAGAVTGVPEDVARLLVDGLRRAHLLQPAPGENTYRFHDLLRLYAEDRGRHEDAADDRAAAVRRLLAHYEDTALDADSHLNAAVPDEERSPRFATRDDALAWFDAERPNLVAAVDLAVADGHPCHATAIPHNMYWFFALRKHWADWSTTHAIAVTAAHSSGDQRTAATMVNRLGNAWFQQAHFNEAVTCYEQALALFEEIADVRGQGQALSNLGAAFTSLGRYDDALDHYRRALKRYRRTGDRRGEGQTLNNLGSAHRKFGHHQKAIEHLLHARTIYQEIGDRSGEVQSLANLASTYTNLGRLDDGLPLHQLVIATYRELSDQYSAGLALGNLGIAYQYQLADPARALDCYRQAEAAFEAVEATSQIEWVRSLAAELPPARGRWIRSLFDRNRRKT